MTDDGDAMTSPLSEPSTCDNIFNNEGYPTSSGQPTQMKVCSLRTVSHTGCCLLTCCQLPSEALWRYSNSSV